MGLGIRYMQHNVDGNDRLPRRMCFLSHSMCRNLWSHHRFRFSQKNIESIGHLGSNLCSQIKSWDLRYPVYSPFKWICCAWIWNFIDSKQFRSQWGNVRLEWHHAFSQKLHCVLMFQKIDMVHVYIIDDAGRSFGYSDIPGSWHQKQRQKWYLL